MLGNQHLGIQRGKHPAGGGGVTNNADQCRMVFVLNSIRRDEKAVMFSNSDPQKYLISPKFYDIEGSIMI